MRHLIDTYIRAEESQKVTEFEDLSLIQLIVQRGVEAVKELPKPIRDKESATAETIENNVRKLIIDEQPINPKYYERMSQLLDALIADRRNKALKYEEYLKEMAALARKVVQPEAEAYPPAVSSPAQRALFDNLERDEGLALAVDKAVRDSRQDDWRGNQFKVKRVRNAIRAALGGEGDRAEEILEIVKNQNGY
jgi:type I restriction enzyme R subunit